MKFTALMAASWLMVASLACAQDKPSVAATPPAGGEQQNSSTVGSYGIGLSAANGLKSTGMAVDIEALIAGLRDGFKGLKPKYSEEQLQMAIEYLQREAESKQEEIQKAQGEKNLREGSAFLEANKARKGVTTTASGLQYEVIKEGKGANPRYSDTVRVNYEGKLLDGTVFDSSIKRNEPAEFRVGQVIKGWVEALQLMKVGDHWKIYIPAGLAYGAQGAGGVIQPNSVLTFDVELLGIIPSSDKDKAEADKAK